MKALLVLRTIVLMFLLSAAPVLGHASNQCAEAFIGELPRADLATDRTQEQLSVIISEIDSILRLPEHVSLDGRITKLIDDRVVEVLDSLGHEIRQSNRDANDILSGQRANRATELSRQLEKDLAAISKKMSGQKSMVAKLIPMVPRMTERQIQALQNRIGITHSEVEGLLKEIDRDDGILRDLEIVLFEKRQAINEQLDILKAVRDELQQRIWQAGSTQAREVLALQAAVSAAESHTKDLVTLAQLIEATDKNVKLTLKVNSEARSTTLRIAKTMINTLQLSGVGRLDLSKRDSESKTAEVLEAYKDQLEKAEKAGSKTSDHEQQAEKKVLRELRKVPLQQLFEKLGPVPTELLAKALEDRFLTQQSFSADEVLILLGQKYWYRFQNYQYGDWRGFSHVHPSEYFAYPNQPFKVYRNRATGSIGVAYKLLSSPIRLPVLMTRAVVQGGPRQNFQLPSYLVLLALEKIDLETTTREQWTNIKRLIPTYMSVEFDGGSAKLSEVAIKHTEARLERAWSRRDGQRLLNEMTGGEK